MTPPQSVSTGDANLGALQGVRILDFTHVYQGPVCTQLLADFGADVIKVERPGMGDWSRQWGPFVGDVSLPYAGLNRNKRSLALNLKDERGLAIMHKLVTRSDVLVHNFRPGAMEKLGLGYDDARKLNPRLVYATSSGWGDEGPYVERGRGGHDMMARATSGLFDGVDKFGQPAPAGISADYVAGLLLGQAILIALLARERTGEGQCVTTDLLSAGFHANTWNGTQQLNPDRIDREGHIGAAEKALRRVYRTADDYIELSPTFSPTGFQDLALALGLDDLPEDPRFSTNDALLAHREELNQIVAARFAEQTTSAWMAQLEPQGILCAEVKTFEQAAEDEQVHANNMVIDLQHPRAGTLKVQGTPIRMSETPSHIDRAPPDLGADGRQILAELEYDPGEIDVFASDGVFDEE